MQEAISDENAQRSTQLRATYQSNERRILGLLSTIGS